MTEPKKRGRKPIGEQAMTPAERKRRSRQNKLANGYMEVCLSIKQQSKNFIEDFANERGITMDQAVDQIIQLQEQQQ